MSTQTRRWRSSRVVCLVVLALVVSACGTRMSHEAVVKSAENEANTTSAPRLGTAAGRGAVNGTGNSAGSAGRDQVDPGVPGTPPAPGTIPGSGQSPPATSLAAAAAQAPGPGARPQAPTAGATPPPTRPGASAQVYGTGAGPQPTGTEDAAVVPDPGAGGSQASGPKSVVKLGLVGTLSGPTGPFFIHHLHGVQLWQKWVNVRGGVNGHPVQLAVGDNAGDPARHKALTQDLVENQHVLAFILNIEVFSGPSAIGYLESKRIPIIGLSGSEPHAYSSPMYFPQASAGQVFYDTMFASWAQQMIPQGKRKFAILACAESQVCQQIYDETEEQTRRRGLELVYKARISLAQPDFTAECLAARNAGTELLFVLADGNTQRRVVTSCDRQSFRPVFVSAAEAVSHDMQDEPAMNNRLISSLVTFPYVADTPVAAEFQAARKQYGSDLKLGGGLTIGWVAGKLFEKAAANISEPPTTEAILAGLWSIKDEDLGGITRPLTFTEGQPATPKACWWNLAIIDGKWRSPDGFQRHCD